MANGSKKLARQQKQLLKKQAQQTAQGNRIPSLVTNIPPGLSEHRGEKFKLIFEYYDHSECEMISMTKPEMKKVINTFKKITKYDQTNISKLCRPDPVKRAGAGKGYANLFKNLPDDFDSLLEIYFTGSGRIFVYPYQDMCCVVAIGKKHR